MHNTEPGQLQTINSRVKHFYEVDYASADLGADLRRPQDRIRACFTPGPVGMRILDVGCGPAVQTGFLSMENEVHGIDISKHALEHAAQRGLITHHVSVEEEGIPFPDEYFDIVVCTDLLEHLFDPMFTLQEIRRVLRRTGYAILAVPNHFFWLMRLRLLVGYNLVLPWHEQPESSQEWNYIHIRFFTQQGFERLLEHAHFSIVKSFYDSFYVARPRILPTSWYRRMVRQWPSLFSLSFLVQVIPCSE